jgi:uncharacterized membrane protein
MKEVRMNLVERVKNIILSPASEWEVIKGETCTTADLFKQYAMILAAIPALGGFIGFSVIGAFFGLGVFRLPFHYGLVHCVLSYVLSLVGVYLLAIIIDRLSQNFGATRDMEAAFKIAVFSMTPFWISGVFLIVPALGVITLIAGLYGLYLLYLGIKQLTDAPAEKHLGFFVTTLLVAIIIQVIMNGIVRGVVFRGPMMM